MDLDVLVWFGEHRSDFLTKLMSVITYAGSEIAAIGVACLVYWCFNRKTGNRLLLTMLSSLLLSQLMKIVFVARRPWVRSERVKPVDSAVKDATGYSFPSGHTANAAALYGGLSYGKKVKPIWKILSWILVALVGISRLYLGVHTPQDVIVGLLLSVILIFFIGFVSDKLESKPSLDIWVCGCALLLSAVTLVIALTRSFPGTADEIARNKQDAFKLAGAVIGMSIGWLLERRVVKFDKPEKPFYAAIRLIAGLVVVLALLKGTKSVFNSLLGSEVGGIVRYLITCFTAIFLWPLGFTAMEKRLDAKNK